MDNVFIPKHQELVKNSVTTCFGIDQTNTVEYRFNQFGYRGDNPTNQPSIIAIGNTITFGIGLKEDQTYPSIVAKQLGLKCINFSFVCYGHENKEHLPNIQFLASRPTSDIFLVQVNNICRRRISETDLEFTCLDHESNLSRLVKYLNDVESILKNKRIILLHWDDTPDTHLPKPITDKFLIYNKFHLDYSLPDNVKTFGVRSHRAIANVILSKLCQLNKCC